MLFSFNLIVTFTKPVVPDDDLGRKTTQLLFEFKYNKERETQMGFLYMVFKEIVKMLNKSVIKHVLKISVDQQGVNNLGRFLPRDGKFYFYDSGTRDAQIKKWAMMKNRIIKRIEQQSKRMGSKRRGSKRIGPKRRT